MAEPERLPARRKLASRWPGEGKSRNGNMWVKKGERRKRAEMRSIASLAMLNTEIQKLKKKCRCVGRKTFSFDRLHVIRTDPDVTSFHLACRPTCEMMITVQRSVSEQCEL